jgi:hypothetical protein
MEPWFLRAFRQGARFSDMSRARTLLLVASSIVAVACARGDARDDSSTARVGAGNDSAFAALQQRGADTRAMGVDQYTSTHRFDALPDGGRIELQRDVEDSAGTVQIRRHLRAVAMAFTAGDFTTPLFVHARDVPGTEVMAAKRAAIAYAVHDLPRGAELRITTRDTDALRAVHAFLAFQRGEHHADGLVDDGHAHDRMAR